MFHRWLGFGNPWPRKVASYTSQDALAVASGAEAPSVPSERLGGPKPPLMSQDIA
jgi:hypothetical protein